MALRAAVPRTMRILVVVAGAAMGLAPAVPAQSIDRARQLFDESRFQAAKAELLAVQKADGRSAAAAYYLGRIARIENDGDEALRQLERAVQLDEGNALYHYWLGVAVGDAAQRSSTIRMALMARRVRKEWERAVALDPNRVDARFGLVEFYAAAPGLWGGGIDKARAQAAEIATRDAMRGAMARGIVAEHEKKPAAVEAAYLEAITLAPDSLVAYVALADARADAGRAADALAALDGYARRHPDDHWTLFHVGRTAGASGLQMDRGQRALEQFLAAPPPDAYAPTLGLAHYWLGQLAEKRGAKEEAREHYQAALKVNPKSRLSKSALEALKPGRVSPGTPASKPQ